MHIGFGLVAIFSRVAGFVICLNRYQHVWVERMIDSEFWRFNWEDESAENGIREAIEIQLAPGPHSQSTQSRQRLQTTSGLFGHFVPYLRTSSHVT